MWAFCGRSPPPRSGETGVGYDEVVTRRRARARRRSNDDGCADEPTLQPRHVASLRRALGATCGPMCVASERRRSARTMANRARLAGAVRCGKPRHRLALPGLFLVDGAVRSIADRDAAQAPAIGRLDGPLHDVTVRPHDIVVAGVKTDAEADAVEVMVMMMVLPGES